VTGTRSGLRQTAGFESAISVTEMFNYLPQLSSKYVLLKSLFPANFRMPRHIIRSKRETSAL